MRSPSGGLPPVEASAALIHDTFYLDTQHSTTAANYSSVCILTHPDFDISSCISFDSVMGRLLSARRPKLQAGTRLYGGLDTLT